MISKSIKNVSVIIDMSILFLILIYIFIFINNIEHGLNKNQEYKKKVCIIDSIEVVETPADRYYDIPPSMSRTLLREEIILAQLVEAEAGNQDLTGKRLVVDVILNRVDHPDFPNTIEEVIFQEGQFGPISDGRFYQMQGNISEESYQAVVLESKNRLDYGLIYFNTTLDNGINGYKYGDHWFSY